jgi:hypothetical protein
MTDRIWPNKNIKVTLHSLKGAGDMQQKLARRAVEELEWALNHPSFADRVKRKQFTRWHTNEHHRETELGVEEVLTIIESGRELYSDADHEIDLSVRLQYMPRAVGKTPIGGPVIRTAYWFMRSCVRDDNPAELAAHWMHEWLHVAGFHHHGGNDARGDVPYVVGEVVLEMVSEKLGLGPA